MLLYYIRHGDPVYDPNQLTPLGEEQAKAVARRLARYGFDEIYTSTSNRAIQTAQPLCDLLKKEAIQLDWCNEKYASRLFSYPMEDGKRNFVSGSPEMRRLFVSKEFRQLGENWYEHPKLSGESFKEGVELYNRETDNLLASLGYRRHPEDSYYIPEAPNDKRVAIFAHWGVGGAMMSHILSIPYPQFVLSFGLSHSTVSVIEFRETNGITIPIALTYCNDSHLYREGLPTRYENRQFI